MIARQLRAKLEGTGIDPARITELELVPRTPDGRFWLLDVSSRQRSFPASDPIHLPRISVSDVIVAEGDAGEFTLEVPIHIDGVVRERARLWVQLTDYADFENPVQGFPLVLKPGATSASVPFSYVADDIFTPFPRNTQVVLLAQENAVTADYDGTILVEEDDPPPVLSVDASRVTATEGATLTWTFRLSEPMAFDAFWSIEFQSPAGRFPELDSDDVPRSWLKAMGFTPPKIPVPLSQLGIWLYIQFAPGDLVATVSIPIATDGAAEKREGVMLVLDGFGDPVIPEPIELTGVVP